MSYLEQPVSQAAIEAQVIPAGQHPVQIEKIDADALFVLKKLSSAGFAAYLVGGGVRDIYLGKKPKDFDISTSARPGQIRRLFPNSATIGKRFRLVQVFFRGGKIIEVSTLRSLSEHDLTHPDSVLAPNNSFGTLEEDAQRRDLTINSLFFDIADHSVIDHVSGVDDLQRSLVRLIGLPEKRVHTDPVRMLRVIRHSARAAFSIEPSTWKAICENRHKLTLCPPSRIRDELLKDLNSGAAADWFRLAVDSGIFPVIFPLYQKILSAKSTRAEKCASQIQDLLALVDQVNKPTPEPAKPLPDSFLLAVLLIPYVELTYRFYSEKRKGPALFQLSRRLRNEIDAGIGVQLNLRRSLRQDVTALVTNLSLLVHHRENDDWPKWLRKKTYFAETHLLYSWYMAATTGNNQETEIHVPELPQKAVDELREKSAKPEERRGTKPAFSSVKKGGIFGFKK